MSEVEVVIQMSKFCPFCQRECVREGCRLWSGQFDACGVAVNHLALARVAEALQEVVAFISSSPLSLPGRGRLVREAGEGGASGLSQAPDPPLSPP